ncbi:hypothetical protein BDN70DRAFT_869786 [Pholiota conissans]|uniref:Fibronectin type-III domain-containing protein n=1 Tax=Pholiota conissans TaxID=109636 RepID=A0A9P6CZE7_9AGAR|nr:hypothetical protein BDN70DRAFT_869786 [Pholiota conissans]
MSRLGRTFWLQLALAGLSVVKSAQSFTVTPNLPLSFLFSWGDPTLPFTIPVSEQCETLHITWSRQSATGPNPTAPYFLQVYTSNFIQPFVIPAGTGLTFDWQVPFAPGTLYQICMFDKFGNTGGCQETYTVIAPSSPASCPNVTFVPQLQVIATVNTGPMSQYGFIDQCTDISLQPTGGTPPFTLTVAPALHPPYNITSFDMKSINWTLSLNWASPFYISLADSSGSLWSNGPLHAGGGGTIACLSGNVTSSHNVPAHVAIGVSFLSLFIGIAFGLGGLFLHLKRRESRSVQLQSSSPISTWGRSLVQTPLQNHINPFQTDEERAANQTQVYVLHHDDNGIPPVTIIHNNRTEIVELPPRYPSYTEAESEAMREMRSDRLGSPSTISAVNSLSAHDGEDIPHYDPGGPLRLHSLRQPSLLPRKLSASSRT